MRSCEGCIALGGGTDEPIFKSVYAMLIDSGRYGKDGCSLSNWGRIKLREDCDEVVLDSPITMSSILSLIREDRCASEVIQKHT